MHSPLFVVFVLACLLLPSTRALHMARDAYRRPSHPAETAATDTNAEETGAVTAARSDKSNAGDPLMMFEQDVAEAIDLDPFGTLPRSILRLETIEERRLPLPQHRQQPMLPPQRQQQKRQPLQQQQSPVEQERARLSLQSLFDSIGAAMDADTNTAEKLRPGYSAAQLMEFRIEHQHKLQEQLEQRNQIHQQEVQQKDEQQRRLKKQKPSTGNEALTQRQMRQQHQQQHRRRLMILNPMSVTNDGHITSNDVNLNPAAYDQLRPRQLFPVVQRRHQMIINARPRAHSGGNRQNSNRDEDAPESDSNERNNEINRGDSDLDVVVPMTVVIAKSSPVDGPKGDVTAAGHVAAAAILSTNSKRASKSSSAYAWQRGGGGSSMGNADSGKSMIGTDRIVGGGGGDGGYMMNGGAQMPPAIMPNIASQLMLRSSRAQRNYDVPQIGE